MSTPASMSLGTANRCEFRDRTDGTAQTGTEVLAATAQHGIAPTDCLRLSDRHRDSLAGRYD
jgi:hypothetical protein